MIYILGYRPDEFGLVPDPDGYIPYKELLQAIHEEQGWGYVRQGHFNEILMGNDRSLFQWDEKRIRVLKRDWQLDLKNPLDNNLPKILFIAVRRRSHAHVMEKGLSSSPDKYLPLSPEKEMAIRIGSRRDQNPVLLEVMAHPAKQVGIPFYAFGHLLLAKEIPKDFISGPPVSRDVVPVREERAKRTEERPLDFTPGSFLLEPDRQTVPKPHTKGKKRKGWKENSRKIRKNRGR